MRMRELIAELKDTYGPVALRPGMVVRVVMLGQQAQGKVKSSGSGRVVIETGQGDIEIHAGGAGNDFVLGGYTNTRIVSPSVGGGSTGR